MGTLNLASTDQVVLWENELCGQISDGRWENSTPKDHWKPWCRCFVGVDRENLGRDFYVNRDKYNFTASDFLDLLSKRMILYVKLNRIFGFEKAKLVSRFYDLHGNWEGYPLYKGKFWDEQRQKLRNFLVEYDLNLDDLRLGVEEESYSLTDLKKDLKQIKEIMKIRRM